MSAPREPSAVTHVLHLRDGEVRANEPSPGFWVVSWYPHRSDHPDHPDATIDSAHESMPTEGGADAILEWARERFETDDPRILAEVSVEEGASKEELDALQALLTKLARPPSSMQGSFGGPPISCLGRCSSRHRWSPS